MFNLVRAAITGSAALIICLTSTLSAAASVDKDVYGYLAAIGAKSIATAPVNNTPRPIVIAIVDDAINIDHVHIKPFIADGGYDVADNDDDVRAPVERLEAYGHGTFLADAMARVLRHTLGPAAHEFVKILPIKSLSDHSTSLQLEAAFEGMEYATSLQADIVVTAWAIHTLTPQQRKSLETVPLANTLLIASAGNERIEKTMFPAAHPASLSVGGLDQHMQLWQGSNRGDFVDLSAPAVNISGTDYLGIKTIIDSGTSLPTALVAAAAAVVKVHNPGFSAHEVRACLLNESAELNVERSSDRGKFGAGLLDVASAAACHSINALGASDAQKDEVSFDITRSRGYLLADNSTAKQPWRVRTVGEYSGLELQWEPTGSEAYPATLSLSLTSKAAQTEQITLAPGEPKRLEYVPESIRLLQPGSTSGQTKKTPTKTESTLISYRFLSEKAHTRWCSGTTIITEDTTVTDGSDSEDYAAHSDCKWLFVAPQGKLFEFEITSLDTEPTTDQLFFFNGDGTHEELIGVLSGSQLPPEFRSWNDKTLLWFVSDGNNEAGGWSINARIVEQTAIQ